MNLSTENIIKYFLVIFFFVHQIVLFYFRSYRVYKNTGINPFVFGRTSSLHDFMGKTSLLVSILNLINIVIYAFYDNIENYATLLIVEDNLYIKITGVLVLIFSFVISITAQIQMGNSWRIGIDKKNKTMLVTKGLFKYSRNPFFLGVLLSLTGILIIIPNLLSIFTLAAGYFFMQIQIRLEEEYMIKNVPEYSEYFGKVRRWL